MRAADERRPLRELVEVDPDVALVLTPDQIAACFDERLLLRNVNAVIARLDTLEVPNHVRS